MRSMHDGRWADRGRSNDFHSRCSGCIRRQASLLFLGLDDSGKSTYLSLLQERCDGASRGNSKMEMGGWRTDCAPWEDAVCFVVMKEVRLAEECHCAESGEGYQGF